MKSKKNKTQGTLAGGDLAEFSQAYGKRFESAEAMVGSLDAVVWLLKSRYLKSASSSGRGDAFGFIIRKMEVHFSKSVAEEIIQADFADGAYVILAPEREGESLELRDLRRRELLLFFGPLIPEAQIRATMQMHRLLSRQAQDELNEKYAQQKTEIKNP